VSEKDEMSDGSTSTNPIAITGMHRSGTSMITRGLHDSGLHLIGGDADALLEAADDNPEGFWENKAIVTCNDDLLEAAGGSWDNPPPLLPVAVDDARLAAVVEPATAALAGLAENERWGFKDPRTCLTAAFWLDLQPNLRFVVCVRNPLEVALSLKRRNQNSYSLGLSLWERYYESVLELVPEDRRIVTHYDTYFLDPAGELGRVCDFAGLEPAAVEVRSELRHHDVGVSLDEANLGAGVRDLYSRLCEEAGTPAPRPSVVDEGQVRRLVLDGTVSARHAEQRQKAIARLEERLAESQGAEKSMRDELQRVRRESDERKLLLESATRELEHLRHDVASRFDAIEAQNLRLIDNTETLGETSHRLEDRQRAVLERTNHMGEILDAVHVKLRAVESGVAEVRSASVRHRLRRVARGLARRVTGRGVPVAKKTVKATAQRMPEPVQHNLRRVRRSVADGQAGNRVKSRVARAVNQLPEPAQKAARRGTTAVRRSGLVPKSRTVVRRVAGQLPAPAKTKIKTLMGRTPARGKAAPKARRKAAPAPRPRERDDGRAAEVPKGPASFKWQKGYERLVAEMIPSGASWAVVTPGCKAGVGSVAGRTAESFPSGDGEAPAADSVALIAILEAMRLRGVEHLVLPEGARAWYQSHPELRDHLCRSHRVVVDRPGAGAVFDLTAASVDPQGALTVVKDLSMGRAAPPAVLDWTDLDISDDLPGFTTFAPAAGAMSATAKLPYLDDSIEIVVTTGNHDVGEAIRVASIAVLVCARVGLELITERVEMVDDADQPGRGVAVIATAGTAEVDALVRSRIEELGATAYFGEAPESVDAEVVMVLEPGVVPLPGTIAAAAAAVRRSPMAVSVAKVLDDHGRIESAGGTVFADGSVARVGEGTLDVRAPWHEFTRPVCWGGGIVAATAEVWAAVPEFDVDGLVDWCGGVWESGRRIEYRSGATVVRVADRPLLPTLAGGVWSSHLRVRPARPEKLGNGAWRYLLANDDILSLLPGADA